MDSGLPHLQLHVCQGKESLDYQQFHSLEFQQKKVNFLLQGMYVSLIPLKNILEENLERNKNLIS